MRMAICRLTSEISVVGSTAALPIGPGAEVDLDRQVGPGCTLADALGPELLASFEEVAPAATAANVQPPRRVRGSQSSVTDDMKQE